MTLKELRKKYPQYDKLSDIEFIKKMHGIFAKNKPIEEFAKKFGIEIYSKTTEVEVPKKNGNQLQEFIKALEDTFKKNALSHASMLKSVVAAMPEKAPEVKVENLVVGPREIKAIGIERDEQGKMKKLHIIREK